MFDYVFLGKPYSASCAVSGELMREMRDEFEYWYPMDLRVSAKDLIPNHLTMSLYNHVEIWKDRPELWPKGIFCNGHVMVDAEKMSKSMGNFVMMNECCDGLVNIRIRNPKDPKGDKVEETFAFCADATRFALADAGDTMEDANFDPSVANQAVSYLFVEEEWCRLMIDEDKNGKFRTGPMLFMDVGLNNEIDYLIQETYSEFQQMRYREGMSLVDNSFSS